MLEPEENLDQETQRPDESQSLAASIAEYTRDPSGFVLFAFPWGEGELEGYDGPDEWQIEILKALGEGLINVDQAIKIAIASGHGIGKSALVAWIILWAVSTFEDTRGVVTANTDTQLRTKTWPELAKWHRLFIGKELFTLTATALYSTQPEHEKTWRIDIIPWSENNTEAFAGLHNQGKRIVLIFDEASAIVNKIWEVSEGALTDIDTEMIWCAFGNPTRNEGRFFDCFHNLKHRWIHKQIDSRTVKITNKKQIQELVDDNGEDSDIVRIRVRGMFPRASESQFIGSDIVEAARGKHLPPHAYNFAPKILILDNAWTGGDEIVIGMRQGNAYKILSTFAKNDDDLVIAGHLARHEDEEAADAVLIDLGYGTGVFSAGKNMGRTWTLLPMGNPSPDPGYLNLRAYCWGQMKKWLMEGGVIPNDPVLAEEIQRPMAFNVPTGKNAGKVYLESKKDMRSRGVSSPNRADNLAMSFAVPVRKKTNIASKQAPKIYDPYANEPQQRVQPQGYDPYK